MKTISLIVPCYNEKENIQYFMDEVNNKLITNQKKYTFQVVAVNDGSTDGTLEKLIQIQQKYSFLKVIDLSRNFGKEAALSAGLKYSDGDAVVPIDADLQHPLEAIDRMILLWEEGYDVVLAKRTDRKTDHALQKFTAQSFYKAHNAISDIDIPADVGDFRLMDKKVVDALNQLPENRRFMKGLFAWVGFKTTTIDYEVNSRLYGESKFNTWKLWNFALEGITSFSIAPLKIWTYIGMFISSLSFMYAIFLIFKTLFFGADLAGYPSLMVAILFIGGIQLISIGILGEYIGRIYIESKKRPPYIIKKIIEKNNDDF